jgi:hypothetical protein
MPVRHKASSGSHNEEPSNGANIPQVDTSDQAMLTLLEQIKVTTETAELRRLTDRLERLIFHKQFENT